MSTRWREWPLVARFGRWLGWNGTNSADRYSAADVEHMARALGVSTVELGVVETDSNTELLHRRMVTLGLDPYELAGSEPALMRDMQRLCTACETREHCLRDFARQALDPTWRGWREHCPNDAALNMLGILRRCSEPPTQARFPYV